MYSPAVSRNVLLVPDIVSILEWAQGIHITVHPYPRKSLRILISSNLERLMQYFFLVKASCPEVYWSNCNLWLFRPKVHPSISKMKKLLYYYIVRGFWCRRAGDLESIIWFHACPGSTVMIIHNVLFPRCEPSEKFMHRCQVWVSVHASLQACLPCRKLEHELSSKFN